MQHTTILINGESRRKHDQSLEEHVPGVVLTISRIATVLQMIVSVTDVSEKDISLLYATQNFLHKLILTQHFFKTKFKLDTGTEVTAISQEIFQSIKVQTLVPPL